MAIDSCLPNWVVAVIKLIEGGNMIVGMADAKMSYHNETLTHK